MVNFYENLYEFIWCFSNFCLFCFEGYFRIFQFFCLPVLVWVCVDGKSTSNLATLDFRLGASNSRLVDELSTRPDYFRFLSHQFHQKELSLVASWIPLATCDTFKDTQNTCYRNGIFFDRWVGDDGAHSLLPLDQLGKLVISHISLHPPYIKILGSESLSWVVFVGPRIFSRLLGLGCLSGMLMQVPTWKSPRFLHVFGVKCFEVSPCCFFSPEVSIDKKEV